MNVHAVRNPMLWYGRTPCYGVVINAMMHVISMAWLGNEWLCGAQPHGMVWLYSVLWRDDKCHVVHHPRVVAW